MAASLLIIGIGLFLALAGLLNWEWFLNYQAKRYLFSFEKMFGRSGARISYVILGAIFVVAGIINM